MLRVAEASAVIFNLVLPDECRLCEKPLRNLSKIPVCPSCLALPEPLQADFSCVTCGTPFVNSFPLDENGLCTVCRSGGLTFDACNSFGNYEGALRSLIHLFKYGKVESLAKPLGRFVASALPVDTGIDLAMAMPMHWRKRWERGFNQAELLTREVAKQRRIPVSHELRRTRYTKAQAGLTGQKRQENLTSSFAVKHAAAVRGKRILLVDDVMTTGATLQAASETLKSAGAAYVCALTLARVEGKTLEVSTLVAPSASSRIGSTEICLEKRSVSDAKLGSTS